MQGDAVKDFIFWLQFHVWHLFASPAAYSQVFIGRFSQCDICILIILLLIAIVLVKV